MLSKKKNKRYNQLFAEIKKLRFVCSADTGTKLQEKCKVEMSYDEI